jgi:hypothetical protein
MVVYIDAEELCDLLDDPPTSPFDTSHDPFKFGNLASAIPNAFVTGHAYARVCQIPGPDPIHFTDDDAPASTSVNVNQDFVIDVYWDLSGPLISAFCGSWDLTIFFDCASDATLDFQIKNTDNIDYGCPDPNCYPNGTTANTRQYHASFLVPADTVKVNAPAGTPYELDVAIVLLDTCNSLPTTGITGSVPVGEILFIDETYSAVLADNGISKDIVSDSQRDLPTDDTKRAEEVKFVENEVVEDDISTLRIYITEEPLTAQNFTTIISALNELHTKAWLIQQGRFPELINYAQTHDIRFTKEANLTIGKLAHNSPTLAELILNPTTLAAAAGAIVTLAGALKIVIDNIGQTSLRFKEKELDIEIRRQEAQQAQQTAAQKAGQEGQKAQLEIEKQQLEIERKRLEVEKNRVEVALETASKMVDTLRPGIEKETKGMLVQALLPSVLQLGNAKGLELADNEEGATQEES